MSNWIPGIEIESANDFLLQFLYLEEESNEPIDILINSPGGEVNAEQTVAFGICDAIVERIPLK